MPRANGEGHSELTGQQWVCVDVESVVEDDSVPTISGVLARVYVDDLEQALVFYGRLSDEQESVRFAFRDVQLARVGPFLLISGNTDSYRDRTATLLLEDLTPVLDALLMADGQIVEGPTPAPNGRRLIARHPDGSIFEYIEGA